MVREYVPADPPGKRREPPAEPEATVAVTEKVYRPAAAWPEYAQLALARLYREREEARELAIAWYWAGINGQLSRGPVTGETVGLLRRSEAEDWIAKSEKP